MAAIDLHLHTSASDGKLTPRDLIRLCARTGLKAVAVTDHDTVEGIAEAISEAQNHPELTVIPGIELSTHLPGSELHLLGYFIDCCHPVLLDALRSMRLDRQARARAMVEKLNDLGINLEWQQVCRTAGDSNIGRPHIALALMEAGFISRFDEAFELYLAHGKPAYVERFKITPAEGVQLIKQCGGLPVMAHPLTVDNYASVITDLTRAGLEGIEVYYKDFDRQQRRGLLGLAQKLNLVATGGSDYHGIDDSLEIMPGQAGVPRSALSGLLNRARQNGILIESGGRSE